MDIIGEGPEKKAPEYILLCVVAISLAIFPVSSCGAAINYFEMPGSPPTDIESYKDRIVWIDSGYESGRNAFFSDKTQAVMVFDTNNRTGKIIWTNPYPKRSLAVKGNYVCWLEEVPFGTDILIYEAISGDLFRLSSVNPKKNLAISDHLVFWSEKDEKNFSDIYSYDLSSGQSKTIIRDLEGLVNFDADDGYLAIVLKNETAVRLCCYCISDNSLYDILLCNSTISSFSISEDKVVWCERDGNSSDIWMSEPDGRASPVRLNQGRNADNPSVSRDFVVWTENEDCGGKVCIYDIATGTRKIPYSDREPIFLSRNSGSAAVWTEKKRDGAYEIYYSSLEMYLQDIDGSSSGVVNETSLSGISGKKIIQGQSDWYSVDVPSGVRMIYLDLFWTTPDNRLSVTLIGPDSSIKRFTIKDSPENDSRICVSVEKNTGIPPGKWVCIVLGEMISTEDHYDFRWMDYSCSE